MQEITTGTEKQITYAASLREETVAKLHATADNRDESYYRRRLAALKAERLSECADAATIIDWCKGHFNADNQEIVNGYEMEAIRQQVIADKKAFEASHPQPAKPESSPIIPGRGRRRRQPVELTPEQQQAKAEWAEYNARYAEWEDSLEAYMTRVAAARQTKKTVAPQQPATHAAHKNEEPTTTEDEDAADLHRLHFLDLHDVAVIAGISDATARQYHKTARAHRLDGEPHPGDLPAPDVIIGTRSQYAKAGWKRETIDQWMIDRPRKGGVRAFTPGTGYPMDDECTMWLIVTRVTRTQVWLACKIWYPGDKHMERSYQCADIYLGFGEDDRYIELGRRGNLGGSTIIGRGLRIDAKQFVEPPEVFRLDDEDINTPQTRYRMA
ncbi:hypothetical protein D2E25_0231 [Bifidobacterium goeldii]|uniref:Uncharacterized protein n=1 Tax=Bifidobacterium goeldii TaxID=2306975 RepID=A0A430FLX8_9BIFI|nr:hypothetical protein [Bifidobacterium goeldii]RSX53925.1 hypothetical protein D2E25_0231 [Bifidobacterium goeldii]